MTNKKAVEKLREEFCKLKPFCELYPDTCRKEECEIYMSIKALEGKDIQEKDIIQQFHDYQVEWLKSHNDIYLDPQLEELIMHFLHDTANAYMMEMER